MVSSWCSSSLLVLISCHQLMLVDLCCILSLELSCWVRPHETWPIKTMKKAVLVAWKYKRCDFLLHCLDAGIMYSRRQLFSCVLMQSLRHKLFLYGLDLVFPDSSESGLVVWKFRIFSGAIKWQNTVLLLGWDDSQEEWRLWLGNKWLCSRVQWDYLGYALCGKGRTCGCQE